MTAEDFDDVVMTIVGALHVVYVFAAFCAPIYYGIDWWGPIYGLAAGLITGFFLAGIAAEVWWLPLACYAGYLLIKDLVRLT